MNFYLLKFKPELPIDVIRIIHSYDTKCNGKYLCKIHYELCMCCVGHCYTCGDLCKICTRLTNCGHCYEYYCEQCFDKHNKERNIKCSECGNILHKTKTYNPRYKIVGGFGFCYPHLTNKNRKGGECVKCHAIFCEDHTSYSDDEHCYCEECKLTL